MGKSNISLVGEEKCCGCGGCVASCPCNALSMKMSEEGYYTVCINEDDCINCGLCVNCCPTFCDKSELVSKPIELFGGKNRDSVVQEFSSSGGIATALAKAAISEGYKVYGAWFDIEQRELKHVAIEREKDLSLIRGSKYIQSYTVDAFKEIGKAEKVAYIGTPCQIYALRKLYPKKDMLLVDFRCAGTPSYRLLNKYMEYLNSINNSGIKSINFRSKEKSWHIWGVKTVFQDGKVHFEDKHHDLFGKVFSRYHDAVHNVCRQCPFMNRSCADIRVEDAWHLMNYVTKNDYKKGYSQISVFTKKGSKLIEKASLDVCLQKVPNTFEEHTYSFRNKAGKLYQMIQDDDRSLEETVKAYERQMPMTERVLNYISCVVSVNLYVYRATRFVYKCIKGGK